MRKLRYSVAMSADGFIAGPQGEYDWISFDPGYDFAALYSRFDTGLMGRGTYEITLGRGPSVKSMGLKVFVVSSTLAPEQHPDVTVISGGVPEAVREIKAQPGKDIWLFGGGKLFRSLLDEGLVDAVELTVIPIMLGSGVAVLPAGPRCPLKLVECKPLPSGIVTLYYNTRA